MRGHLLGGHHGKISLIRYLFVLISAISYFHCLSYFQTCPSWINRHKFDMTYSQLKSLTKFLALCMAQPIKYFRNNFLVYSPRIHMQIFLLFLSILFQMLCPDHKLRNMYENKLHCFTFTFFTLRTPTRNINFV